MRAALCFSLTLITLLAARTPLRAQAAAAAAPEMLTLSVTNVTARAEAARGAPRADSTVRPGDVLRYHVSFVNTRPTAVRNVALNGPLPAGTAYIAGSAKAAQGGVQPQFSIDSGKTFSANPIITVVVDGQTVTRPAPPERYTNVRWVVESWVQPKATITADYEARLLGGPSPSPRR
jgi:uncharacterized repeat protein (TIGR01451 family)